MTTNIAIRRRARMILLSNIVRPDSSYSDLLGFQRDGYTQVVFIKNLTADEECTPLDGNIYEISELLKLDNPIFRISHPNCLCKFSPYGKSSNSISVLEPELTGIDKEKPSDLIQRPEIPPTTIRPALTPTKTV